MTTLEDANKDPSKKLVSFVICNDKNGYRAQGVPDKPGSFLCRQFFHEKFRGLRGAELQKASGLPDAVFVHSSGFVGFAKSLESVLKMVEFTMENTKPVPIVATVLAEKDKEGNGNKL